MDIGQSSSSPPLGGEVEELRRMLKAFAIAAHVPDDWPFIPAPNESGELVEDYASRVMWGHPLVDDLRCGWLNLDDDRCSMPERAEFARMYMDFLDCWPNLWRLEANNRSSAAPSKRYWFALNLCQLRLCCHVTDALARGEVCADGVPGGALDRVPIDADWMRESEMALDFTKSVIRAADPIFPGFSRVRLYARPTVTRDDLRFRQEKDKVEECVAWIVREYERRATAGEKQLTKADCAECLTTNLKTGRSGLTAIGADVFATLVWPDAVKRIPALARPGRPKKLRRPNSSHRA